MRITGLALSVLLATTAQAADHFKAYAAYSLNVPIYSEQLSRFAHVDWDRDSGWAVGAEYRFNEWGGVAVDYTRMEHNVRLNEQIVGWAQASHVSGNLLLHLIDDDRWGLWFGPTIAYVDWSDLYQINRRTQNIDNEWAVGIFGGGEYRLSPRWSVQGGIRYVQTEVRQGQGGIDVDPLSLRTGVAVRF